MIFLGFCTCLWYNRSIKNGAEDHAFRSKDIQLLELKDTISQLNKTISTQNELISSLQKMLEERNAKDSEKTF